MILARVERVRRFLGLQAIVLMPLTSRQSVLDHHCPRIPNIPGTQYSSALPMMLFSSPNLGNDAPSHKAVSRCATKNETKTLLPAGSHALHPRPRSRESMCPHVSHVRPTRLDTTPYRLQARLSMTRHLVFVMSWCCCAPPALTRRMHRGFCSALMLLLRYGIECDRDERCRSS